ncbi:MAG: BatA domain-containing protein [Acidobacteriota bacterium]|nr:BatA domain-containing protein [Acidobacteriota bacterium]
MGLFAPWFLAGLAAVGLPIYVHLLRKHKTTPLPFSSLMFFERRTQSSIKHRRLQYLLLFALRTLFVILLVLAFARPFLESSTVVAARGGRLIEICVDDSFSMRQGDRFARAKKDALATLDGMRAADRAQIIAFDREARLLTEMTSDGSALRGAVNSIEPGDGASSYAELVRTAGQTPGPPREMHIFSDMQKTSMPSSFSDLQLKEGTKLVPHAEASQSIPNFFVESVHAPRHVYDPKRVRMRATVAGHGNAMATRRVSLVVNGKTLETKPVAVPPDGRGSVEFLSMDATYGLNKGEVRIDSADAFPQDDHFYFSAERSDPRPALFVHDARDTRSLIYFRTALESSNEPAFKLEPVVTEQSANLVPSKYAFVVLSDTGSLPAKFDEALRDYVQKGGSVLIALGKTTSGLRRVPVADLAITGERYASPEGQRFQSAAYLDSLHPAIRRAQRWEGVKFFQAVKVDPGGSRVAAKLSDDTPLLIDKPIGDGRVLVFASTFDNLANDFPLHVAFVPFIEQTSHYLGGLDDTPANYAVGSYVDLRSAREKGGAVEVIGPDGQRALSLSESTKAQTIALTHEGFYDIRRPSGRHELAAVNPDRRESDFAIVPTETLQLWENTGKAPVQNTPGAEPVHESIDLWWYVLLAALILAVAESVLGNRHLAVDKEAA